jgi:hypothetical protein
VSESPEDCGVRVPHCLRWEAQEPHEERESTMKRITFTLAVVVFAATACTPSNPSPVSSTTTSSVQATAREAWIDMFSVTSYGIDSAYYPAGATMQLLGYFMISAISGLPEVCVAVGTVDQSGGNFTPIPSTTFCVPDDGATYDPLPLPPFPLVPGIHRYEVRFVTGGGMLADGSSREQARIRW